MGTPRRSPPKGPPPKLPSSKPSASQSPVLPVSASPPPPPPLPSSLAAPAPKVRSNSPVHSQAPAAQTPAVDPSTSGIAIQTRENPISDLSKSEHGSSSQLQDSATSSHGETVPTSSKPSWVDTVKGPSGNMSRKGDPFTLESGELCVKIPNEVISRNQKRWDAFIIGQFHGNLPSPGALHAILNGIWSNRHRDISISRLGVRTVLIKIPNAATRQRVLGQGLWHIEGQTMFVADWEPGLNPKMPELTEAPVWLEFRGVPPHFFSEEGFEHIAGMLGHPVYCHPSTINMTNLEVGKVLTIINPSVALPEAVNVQFASGEIHRVGVSSPWLPPICSHCEEVGHSIKRCPTAPVTCPACKSTAHAFDSCPRAKKELARDQEPRQDLAPKKKKKKIRSYVPATKWIEKLDNMEKKSHSSKTDGNSLKIQVALGSPPKETQKVKVNHKSKRSSVSRDLKGKGKARSASSSSAESASGSESLVESSSSSSSSEEEFSEEEEEIPFTKVISKKERRQLRNSRRSLKKWIRHYRPTFGSLIETKVKLHKSQKYINSTFPGWNFAGNYEFAELGRIWVVWDPSVRLSIHSKSSQMITCLVHLPNSGKEVAISYIYAVNCKYGRQNLWEEIEGLASDPIIFSKPWVAMGDFNQIMHPSENSTGGTRISKGMYEFRQCALNAGLSDLSFRGSNYTWWNKREANPIAKKLDRVMVNDNWLMEFPLAYATFGDPDVSDHCPGCLVMGTNTPSRKPFMVSHFLMQHRDFIPRVSEFWKDTIVDGTAMFCFSKKLKLLKRVIKDLNKEHFSDLEIRVKEAHSRLTQSQYNLLANPSPILAELEKKAHKDWLTLAMAEEKFLFQRSRVKWVDSGDCNSSYFHRMVSTRRAINQIHYLDDDEGLRIQDKAAIQVHCVDYFSSLLGTASLSLTDADKSLISSLTPYRCDSATKEALQAVISDAEIKKEVFSLPRNKSPGPDGYTGEFFRATWDIIGDDLTRAVKEFFSSGQILKQWNATAITLIPKRVGADKIGEFRPISCCNAVYKIVSKILARRLQSLLPTMISNSQSAFVQGRLLVENVLLATEMVQGFNRGSASARGFLKVDLRKAFDSVNWEFILYILEVSDFPPVFCNWIRLCMTTTSFSIKVNGDLCGFFKGKRGLRQGDPISPPLFFMAMEVFSNLLMSKFDQGRIGYHPLGIHPKITHLAFADDIMLFFDGKAASLQEISLTLESFQTLSGLRMNKDKTDLFYTGVDQTEGDSLDSLGFNHGTLPIRYLGLPLLHRKLRKADYSSLIDQVAARFNCWAVKCLSFAGRLQLISSVIYGLINFWMSAFALPKGCLKHLEKLCNGFLWSGDITKRTAAKVAWDKVCLPKSEGGLGLRNLLVWNKVLNLKLVWLLFSSSGSLWVAWMKEHNLKRSNYWYAEPHANSSWVWKFLLSLRPLAKDLISSNLGDGQTISFWYDKWSPHGILLEFIGSSGPSSMGIPLTATVAEAFYLRDWRLPSRRSRNQNISTIRNYLLSVQPPSLLRGPDSFNWNAGNRSSLSFSTKLTWQQLRHCETSKFWEKAVWFKNSVPKHAFTFWIANMDRLPVKSRLRNWGMHISSVCVLCNSQEENRDHLLLHCSFSETIWHRLLNRLGQHPCIFVDWSTLITWLLSKTQRLSNILKRLTVQAAVFHIWKERNIRVHDNISSSPDSVFSEIDRTIRDTLLARRHRKGCSRLLSHWFSHG
ncbi:Reverse transcriptase domain [Arabidopsis suecica]|uniref:Reverse transcriptase domain n=1 Tax=Arabidopsis suecica TaxID=45249 RepID=A0A8T2BPS5_ARASU|nr:Reverse transcriptase domain [Arabidopsis suecica]